MNCPTICSPLPSKVKVDYPYLEDLHLVDSLNDSYGAIDILVGSDHYWDLVSGETVRGDFGRQQQFAANLAGFYPAP